MLSNTSEELTDLVANKLNFVNSQLFGMILSSNIVWTPLSDVRIWHKRSEMKTAKNFLPLTDSKKLLESNTLIKRNN